MLLRQQVRGRRWTTTVIRATAAAGDAEAARSENAMTGC